MKFEILSHASMLVESNGCRLIIDPWLVGSCYWRSWWNYPAVSETARNIDELDYIYLSHMHWDHFHGPSLNKLPKSATVLIPEAHFRRMKADASLFGFESVVELPHGKTVELEGGLTVASYQYGLFTDSALIIGDGNTTLFDMNDCKLPRSALNRVTSSFPRIDFVFRSHSSASAYPACVQFEEPETKIYRQREDYLSDFVNTTGILGATFAIPFASSHCYLHKETIGYNGIAVSPRDVREYFENSPPKGSTCVEMVSGDSWTEAEGFKLGHRDFFSDRAGIIDEYRIKYSAKLETQYELERCATVSFDLFREYFQTLINSLPRLSRMLFNARVVFIVLGQSNQYWVIDFDSRTVYEVDDLPSEYAFQMTVPALVLNDCIQKHMFATFSASKRLSILVKSGGHKNLLIFLQLLDMYEYEYFPIRQMLRPRFIKVWLRRWREVVGYMRLVTRVLLRRKGEDPLSHFIAKVDTKSTGSN